MTRERSDVVLERGSRADATMGGAQRFGAAPERSLNDLEYLLTAPKRRKLEALRQLFAGLEGGTTVRAVLRCPIFGVYAVTGRVRYSTTVDGFCVGSTILTLRHAPRKRLITVVVGDPDAPIQHPQSEALHDARRIRHGQLVDATFRDRHTHESFRVVGLAVRAEAASMIGVGQWIISSRGAPAPALNRIAIIADVAETTLHCPAPLRSWAELDTQVAITDL